MWTYSSMRSLEKSTNKHFTGGDAAAVTIAAGGEKMAAGDGLGREYSTKQENNVKLTKKYVFRKVEATIAIAVAPVISAASVTAATTTASTTANGGPFNLL